MEKQLKERWDTLCDEYAKAFAKKHGYDIDYELEHGYLWIGHDHGTICEICDMFLDMRDIRYDIDNDIPEDKFEKWYWKSLDIYELTGNKWMNYEAYCKGAPDYYTEERLRDIRKAKQRVEDAKNDLEELIKKDYVGN